MDNKIKRIYLVGDEKQNSFAKYDGETYYGIFVETEDELEARTISSEKLDELLFGAEQDSSSKRRVFQQMIEEEKLVGFPTNDKDLIAIMSEQFGGAEIEASLDEIQVVLGKCKDKEELRLTNPDVAEEEVELAPADAVKPKKWKRRVGIGAAVIGAGVVGYGVGRLHQSLIDKDEKDPDKVIVDDNTSDIDFNFGSQVNLTGLSALEAINEITNADQKEFAQNINSTFHNFYQATHKDNNFRLEADGDAYLTITPSELEAIALTLNDYSKILGNDYADFIAGFDQTQVEMQNNFLSGWQKLSVYYMNAQEPSGLANLILDEENKAFFEDMENKVLAFNANPTQENATEVWRNVYYDYIVAGATGNYQTGGAESVRQNVATLAYSGPFAMAMSHRNVPEMFVVKLDNEAERASANIGDAYLQSGTEFMPLLNQLSDEMTTVIENEDTNKNYNPNALGNVSLNEAVNNIGLCADVFTHIEGVARDISEVRMNDSIAHRNGLDNAKTILTRQLMNANELEAASKVNAADKIDEALLNSLSVSEDARIAIEQYVGSIENLTVGEVSYSDVSEIMNDEAFTLLVNKPASAIKNDDFRIVKEDDFRIVKEDVLTNTKPAEDDEIQMSEAEAIVVLTNNRFKNLVKEDVLTNTKPAEKVLVKEEEKVIAVVTETKTETKKVEKAELPKELQEEATKQENVIVAEIAKDNTDKEATKDAVDYSNSTRYDAKDRLEKYIPGANLNYYSSQRYISAYTDEKIDVNNDQQIKTAVNEDFNDYVSSLTDKEVAGMKSLYGDGWKNKISDIYKTSWISELGQITDKAYNDGQLNKSTLVQDNDKLREEAQKEADRLNEEEAKKNQTDNSKGLDGGEVTITDKAPTVDAPAPTEVPEEMVTHEEVTPPSVDPNIEEQFQEDEVVIDVVTPSPSPTPGVVEEEVTVPQVNIPGQDTGATPEQGGQDLTAEDEKNIADMIAKQEAEAAKDRTEVSNPVMTPPAAPEQSQDPLQTTITASQIKALQEQKKALEEAQKATEQTAPVAVPTAPAATDPILDENSELNFFEEEIELSEPAITR